MVNVFAKYRERERDSMNFEAHAAEVVGGCVPQVRYRASTGRFFVVWQGEVVRYREHNDAETVALNNAEVRILEAVVGLFASDQLTQLSAGVLGDDLAATAEAGARDVPPGHIDAR